MTIKDGYILRIDLNIILKTISTDSITFNIDINQLPSKQYTHKLPIWMKVLNKLTTQSRLQGICALPIMNDSIETWNQQ